MFRQGVYVVPPELPSAIGAEAVGIVEALGGDVSGFSVGDRVTAVPFTTIAGTGVYADTANVPTTTLPAGHAHMLPERNCLACGLPASGRRVRPLRALLHHDPGA